MGWSLHLKSVQTRLDLGLHLYPSRLDQLAERPWLELAAGDRRGLELEGRATAQTRAKMQRKEKTINHKTHSG